MKSDLELSYEADGAKFNEDVRGIPYSIDECVLALLDSRLHMPEYHRNLVKFLILKVKELEQEVLLKISKEVLKGY